MLSKHSTNWAASLAHTIEDLSSCARGALATWPSYSPAWGLIGRDRGLAQKAACDQVSPGGSCARGQLIDFRRWPPATSTKRGACFPFFLRILSRSWRLSQASWGFWEYSICSSGWALTLIKLLPFEAEKEANNRRTRSAGDQNCQGLGHQEPGLS